VSFEAFRDLSDDARLWIYAFESPLTGEQKRIVDDRLRTFMDEWRSHNVDVDGAYTILEDRFVILSGASHEGISGCSIDSSVNNFKYFRDYHGLDALTRDLIHYRDGDGRIRTVNRDAFQTEVDAGRCGSDTTVFDITLQTLGDLRAGRFEMPLSKSWHARIFLSP
jgi:hypothetical protein